MASSRASTNRLAPVSLTLWGCGIIIVWWAVVLSALGIAVGVLWWLVRATVGA